jgi:tRNA threonylcarbamoyladenosine biosynthesis protein TsaB
MYILSVDTSTSSCSVAIIKDLSLVAELTLLSGETHSKHLMRMVQDVLSVSGLDIADLNGYAVVRGPGSFTGLRIGISLVKGLAAATGKPVVGVSSLEVLAFSFQSYPFLICSMLDARRDEVYYAGYFHENGAARTMIEKGVGTPESVLSQINTPCLFVGQGAVVYKNLIREKLGEQAIFPSPDRHMIRAEAVAYLGYDRLKKGEKGNLKQLAPLYIRKSDAEKNREAAG